MTMYNPSGHSRLRNTAIARQATMGWGWRVALPIMLLSLVVLTLAGCAGTPSAPRQSFENLSAVSNREAIVIDESTAQDGGTTVVTRPAASTSRVPSREPVQPVDIGAARLIESMRLALPSQFRTETGRARIALNRLKNQSRSTLDEFQMMQHRLVDLFEPLGRRMSIDFVNRDDEPADYEICGTAYLITADGSDQWEIYLQLRPINDDRRTLWANDAPIRLLRQPSPLGDRLAVPASFN